MDISGLIQSYDPRAASTAALNRPLMGSEYVPGNPYSGAPANTLVASNQQHQHNPFLFGAYSMGAPNGLVPAFENNYIQQRAQHRPTQSETLGERVIPFTRNGRAGFVEEIHSQSPTIKSESQWSMPVGSPTFSGAPTKTGGQLSANGIAEATFKTEVDTLMKTIQAKSHSVPPQASSPVSTSRPVVGVSHTPHYLQGVSQGREQTASEERRYKLTHDDAQDDTGSANGGRRRYQCVIENCTKSFTQKTHLDIHERAHTGVKPYPCKEPGCDRKFSQLGNLKTHERRHTGERPYQCPICGKRFAQRGNVRAHKIVHDQAKPYLCRLDDCGKQFTQLGNLKSHQNKFHIETIRYLTSKFASMQHDDVFNTHERDLWEYFANLYKNSNKGIKGRGKDRKVGPNHAAIKSNRKHRGRAAEGSYSPNGTSQGDTVVSVMGASMGRDVVARRDSQYEIFDDDEESQAGSHAGNGGSSVGTCYDDASSEAFENGGGRLVFSDRMY